VLFFTYSLEAAHDQAFLLILIVALGLGGFSQNFWKAQLSGKQPYAKANLISFGLGLLAAIGYPFVAAWYLFAWYLLVS